MTEKYREALVTGLRQLDVMECAAEDLRVHLLQMSSELEDLFGCHPGFNFSIGLDDKEDLGYRLWVATEECSVALPVKIYFGPNSSGYPALVRWTRPFGRGDAKWYLDRLSDFPNAFRAILSDPNIAMLLKPLMKDPQHALLDRSKTTEKP